MNVCIRFCDSSQNVKLAGSHCRDVFSLFRAIEPSFLEFEWHWQNKILFNYLEYCVKFGAVLITFRGSN